MQTHSFAASSIAATILRSTFALRFEIRFERRTLKLTLAVVPAAKGWTRDELTLKLIDARVQSARVRCASSRGVFESRGEFVRIASLFERARRTSTRRKAVEEDVDFKELEFAGGGTTLGTFNSNRIKK